MRPRCQVSDLFFRYMKLSPAPVTQRRTADHADLAFELDLSDALELFAQDFDFTCELKFVWCVLVMASAADRKQRARRLYPFGRGCEDFQQTRMHVLAGFDSRRFTGQDEWNQHNAALDATESLPAIHPLVYIYVELMNFLLRHRLR